MATSHLAANSTTEPAGHGRRVICPACTHDNRAGAKFCEECAARLKRACANCTAELRPTAKFCDECGAPVGALLTPARNGKHEGGDYEMPLNAVIQLDGTGSVIRADIYDDAIEPALKRLAELAEPSTGAEPFAMYFPPTSS